MLDAAGFGVATLLTAQAWCWASAGGGGDGGEARLCSAAAWQRHAATAAVLGSSAALVACAASSGGWWRRWRTRTVVAYRLGCFRAGARVPHLGPAAGPQRRAAARRARGGWCALGGSLRSSLPALGRLAKACPPAMTKTLGPPLAPPKQAPAPSAWVLFDALLPLLPAREQLLVAAAVQAACLAHSLAATPEVCSTPVRALRVGALPSESDSKSPPAAARRSAALAVAAASCRCPARHPRVLLSTLRPCCSNPMRPPAVLLPTC